MNNSPSLLLVGCGKMGSALLSGWLKEFPDARFDVIEPGSPKTHAGVHCYRSLEYLPQSSAPHVIVFAVKPQALAELLPHYRERFARSNPLYLSIAAGKNLAFYTSHLGAQAHIVRAMPNTPALIGQGMSVLYAAETLSQSNRHTATALMEAVGKVEWLTDEALMDAVTALSGSGPAYVFLFLDSLVKAGVAAGLDEKLARTLALQTVAGSCALAADPLAESLEQLHINVTSPGGTTEAALNILMKNGAFEKLVGEAVAAAQKRSRQLMDASA